MPMVADLLHLAEQLLQGRAFQSRVIFLLDDGMFDLLLSWQEQMGFVLVVGDDTSNVRLVLAMGSGTGFCIASGMLGSCLFRQW